jgi:hypothetical protein
VPTGDRKRGDDDESTHGVFKIILSRRFSRESPTPAPRPEKTIECSLEKMILIQIHPSGNKDQSADMDGHDSSSPTSQDQFLVTHLAFGQAAVTLFQFFRRETKGARE